MPKKAIIKTGYICNNRCLFCRVGQFRESHPALLTEEISAKIKEAKAIGVEMILFSGGEPTVRKDLIRLMHICGEAGLKCGLITNARMFIYKEFLKRLIDAGLSYIHTSLHGSSARTHNSLTMTNSFNEVLTALGNIRKTNIELHVNTVVNKTNMTELRSITDILSCYAPLNHKLSLVEPSGFFNSNMEALLERPLVLAEYAKDSVAYGAARYSQAGITFGLEGFSLCHIRGYEKYIDNLFTHGIEYMSEAYEGEFFPVDHGQRTYVSACQSCVAKDSCPGIYSGFYEIYGESDIFPIKT